MKDDESLSVMLYCCYVVVVVYHYTMNTSSLYPFSYDVYYHIYTSLVLDRANRVEQAVVGRASQKRSSVLTSKVYGKASTKKTTVSFWLVLHVMMKILLL